MSRSLARVKLDVKPLLAKFSQMQSDMRDRTLKRATEAGCLVVQGQARLNAVQALNRHPTGNLVNSITYEVQQISATEWEGLIGPSAIYGAIHEFGGTIVPRTAKMLSWVDESGQRHFAHRVVIPARPYMEPALTEHENDITETVSLQIKADLESYIEE